jgi:hypothetical protein
MEDYLGKVFEAERQLKELRLERERVGGTVTPEEVLQWWRELPSCRLTRRPPLRRP